MIHDYTKGQMVGLAVGFMILPIFFYALRIWAKLLIKRFTLDDYVAGAALVGGQTTSDDFGGDTRADRDITSLYRLHVAPCS
ncbi:hypothetical protein BKA56DRAFT_604426 [Ilyonectria sp. MPI-CAGE-AT-0026]|nr:hypothetical protein BKA56DRAFT_604426 [Ilyonectria sp. MPI-CAGE-AT-0026]